MRCPKCGAETTSRFCPECGMELRQDQLDRNDNSVNELDTRQNAYYNGPNNADDKSKYRAHTSNPTPKVKKHTGLGIAAFVFSLFGPLAIIGIILAIIDIVRDKEKDHKHGLSMAAVIIGVVVLLVVFGNGNDSKKSTTDKTQKTSIEESDKTTPTEEIVEKTNNDVIETKEKKTTTKNSGPIKVGIGDEFGNKTITGVVISVDLDYKDYNDVWTTIESGYKAVYVRIKVTNNSKNSNYVSVGDFSCYVDDVITNAELVSGGNEDYNANIDPGRSAILGALYVVPENAKNIELEYNPIGERADRQIIVLSDESTTETKIFTETDVADNKASSGTDGVRLIGVGDEFGNKTITGIVTDVDLNSKNYNDLWTTVDSDHKAVYVKIKVTNISNESNYVSLGDFSCYVDDVITTAELVTEGNDDYNANIDPGRSAVLGALYVVPKDTKSIELEYNPIGESSERVIIKLQ